jgi:hypothetical protein
MKTGDYWGSAALLLVVCGMSSLGDVTQQDTVVDNRFEFTQAEYVVAEDATNAVIPVRFHPGHRGISGSVPYVTEDITAIAGEDYISVSNILSFSGWTPRFITVPIVRDDLNEGDEILRLRLIGGGWKTMVGPQATAILRITNVPRPDDPRPEPGGARPARKRRPPIVTLNIAERTAVEGGNRAAAVVVRRSNGIENPLPVYYRVTGSARNGADYEKLEGSVVIPTGSHEAMIEIIAVDDGLQERTERMAVHLRPAPRKYRVGAAHRRVIEILDNDQP